METGEMNRLYFGDCLDVLKEIHVENPQGFTDFGVKTKTLCAVSNFSLRKWGCGLDKKDSKIKF